MADSPTPAQPPSAQPTPVQPSPAQPSSAAPSADPVSRKAPNANRRSERSRRAILDAALALVGEVGYDRLTIEAIAARAGVGKQTIYRWWPSRAAVLLDASTALFEDAAAEGEWTGFPDTGDVAADLKHVLRLTVDQFTDEKYEAPTRALTAAGATDPELGRKFTRELLEPSLALYEERLRAAVLAGQVDPGVDIRVAVEMLVGPLTHRWLLRTAPLTHAFADTCVDQVLRGIGARPDSP
ncbi:TetR/AcrR family transcriptional regulator [Streptomyces sp. NBC_01387]|uniref:TetR/AcrR family transcriptional regulator n=1 Tax=unclassified Streptomyces TaxID=2593676 RepID=UPI00202562D7|nr:MULTISPECIES: TetR/AcrR family transcriptional regulator [unclassified Streptomyces]MCX4551449.1 TetR/AcrR family transcriptional regulator [Streptomyces sp. NBC_01500]WSC22840.1 TetR/AcrR family transcriptional regulator [Streptomyces sp. NBC_01766]WSV56752.1 TetR/AcrR family transcriptional regulator [Streptomyces sp. NBC_01014]